MKKVTGVRVARYTPQAVLRVSGEDALAFLQGQFTQDLKRGMAGCVDYGLWLNQKGKVLADSFVLQGSERLAWLVSYHSEASVIRERLESYIIADDVTVEDETGTWRGFVFIGDGAAEWLGSAGVAAPESGRFAEARGGLIWRGRRGVEPSWEWIVPESAGDVAAGVETLSEDAVELLRIAAGIPWVPRDVGAGDLPNEGGLEHDAISYTKGCYLGQEVMARLKAMGQVRRRLVRVSGRQPLLEALPASLFFGDKRVGEVRSAAARDEGWVGLAMILLTGLAPDAALSLSAGGEAVVRVETLEP